MTRLFVTAFFLAILASTAGAMLVWAAKAEAGERAAQPHWFQAIDADRDGAITLPEMHDARYPRFLSFDMNGDGKVSISEISPKGPWRARFRSLDVNGDGIVSGPEFRVQGQQRFQAIDSDRNGRISIDEAVQFQRRAQYQHPVQAG